jgi:hypothetical protein
VDGVTEWIGGSPDFKADVYDAAPRTPAFVSGWLSRWLTSITA